jgi:hypothetical protein
MRRIAALHEIDNTILSYHVETMDVNGEFEKFLLLGPGYSVLIDGKLKQETRDLQHSRFNFLGWESFHRSWLRFESTTL